jgi:hypothetical protein
MRWVAVLETRSFLFGKISFSNLFHPVYLAKMFNIDADRFLARDSDDHETACVGQIESDSSLLG